MIVRRGLGTMIGAAVVAASASMGIAADGHVAVPDVPVDAPELARPGRYPVGVADTLFIQPDQLDPLHGDRQPARADRRIPVTIWFPAARVGPGVVYRTALSGEDGRDVPFEVRGMASAGLRVAAGRFPLVILAHGYGNSPAVLSWLGENLASKGYVVVTPAFRDPPISIRTDAARAGPIARRPLDIAFVTGEAQRRAVARNGIFAQADPDRTALIGYSMGGYGVLTAAGAPLDPRVSTLSRGILAPYAAGGAREGALMVRGVKAVVAIAPAARLSDVPLWTGAGPGAIAAPTLFIVGDRDRVVGYDAVRALFDTPAPAARYLLTFREAGHSIALIGAPATMRRRYWDFDWFEDAVWRKDRLLPIQTHFITAFLDRYVKGDAAMTPYLEGLTPESDAGRWPGAPVGRVARYSPGPPASTVWKGFQPSRAVGMRFDYRPASRP